MNEKAPRIYFVCHESLRTEVARLRAQFHDRGMVVLGSWIDQLVPLVTLPDDQQGRIAQRRLTEIEEADVVVAYQPDGSWPESGAFVELGFAIALVKPVVILGHRLTVFQRLPQVMQVDAPNIDTLVDAIVGMKRHFESKRVNFKRRRADE